MFTNISKNQIANVLILKLVNVLNSLKWQKKAVEEILLTGELVMNMEMEEALPREEADMADTNLMEEAVETLTSITAEVEAGKATEETKEQTEVAMAVATAVAMEAATRIGTNNGDSSSSSSKRIMDLSSKTNKTLEKSTQSYLETLQSHPRFVTLPPHRQSIPPQPKLQLMFRIPQR